MRTPFDIATRALCCKQDIPQVEAIRRLLLNPLRGTLAVLGQDMLTRIDLALANLDTTLGTAHVDLLVEDPEEAARTILAAVLAPFGCYLAILPFEVESLIRQGTAQLFNSAADEQEVDRDFPGRGAVELWLILELHNMLRGLADSRRPEIEELVQSYLTSAALRRNLTAAQLAALPPSDSPRDRAEFEAALAALLLSPIDPESRRKVESSVDRTLEIWAYSAFVVAEVESGLAAGKTIAIAVAKVDSRTTAFCRWVNGRRINMANIKRDLRRRRELARRGSFGVSDRARRFLDPATARRGSPKDFAAFLRKAGLPPYHMGCRTHVKMVRPGEL